MTALVTGAGGGIGAAIAAELADAGYAVVVTDVAPGAADATAAAIRARGGQASALTADLSDATACDALIEKIDGPVRVLVNNAAYHGDRHEFGDVDLAEWHRVIAVNLTAAAFLARAVAPGMAAAGGGSIVNIAAIQADLPLPSYVSYATSKGGLVSLTKALAVELSPRGIRVNAVAPGGIKSGSTRSALDGADDAGASLVGRWGRAADVAAVAGFLCSPAASFVTGTVITVDGGRRLMRPEDPLTRPS